MIEFGKDLFQHGVYVLPCGGGVISEPRWAILRMRGRYGEVGLRERCLELCALPASARAALPEGVLETAHGVLFHLGEPATLAQLIALRQGNLQQDTPPPATAAAAHHLGSLETLVAGLSRKLGRQLPEGVTPLTDPHWERLFCPDNEPTFLNRYGLWLAGAAAGILGTVAVVGLICLVRSVPACFRRIPNQVTT